MCGKCRFCNYEPVTVDAVCCPKCGGWAPNPGVIKRGGVIVNLTVCGLLTVFGVVAFFGGAPGVAWIGLIGLVGFLKGVYRPYGGLQ